MYRLLFCLLLTANGFVAMAQQNRFIYIQTENKQAFYVKLDKKIYSSASSGYVIIPQLTDGSYTLQVGFPKNEWPEQSINCVVDKKDAGYMLKNFGDKGWGLFNLQTLEVLMAGAAAPKEAPVAVKQDAFSSMLSNAVNDPTIQQAPVKAQPTEPVVVKETPPVATEPTKAVPASKINRLLYVNGKQGTEMIYADNNGSKTDTIRILIPIDAKAPPESQPETKVEPKEPIVAPAVKEETPIIKEEKPVVKEEKPVVKEEATTSKEKFINMELPNPATKPTDKQPEVVVPNKEESKQPEPTKRVAMVNSNCRNHAGEDDFMKTRKKMAAEDNDDDMVAVARKIFKTKCFTTEQIKNLAVLFLKDEGRYKFFDAAYPFVSDTDNFPSLETTLTDSYYINRFKAMVKR